MNFSQEISKVTDLIHAGQLDLAKRHVGDTLADTDPHALAVIGRCVAILDAPLEVALPRLRNFWKSCPSQTDRDIIAACAPDTDAARIPQPRQPEPAPRWSRTTLYRAPRDLRTETRPEARRASADPRSADAQRRAYRDANAYADTRAGVEEGTPADQSAGYQLDFDRAALHALRGTPCVRCWIERRRADHDRRHDDGLCTTCRESGRPGIPPLAAGHTLADAVAARCAYIAEHAPPTATHRILQREWTRATTGEHREAIAAWVAAHPDQVDATAQPAAGHSAGHCRTCGSYRALRRKRCDDCAAKTRETDAPVAV